MDLHGCARKPVPRANLVRPETSLPRDVKLLASTLFSPESGLGQPPTAPAQTFIPRDAGGRAIAAWLAQDHPDLVLQKLDDGGDAPAVVGSTCRRARGKPQ